ncbi:MAG: RCC1-like domain-containing protein, partial [Roseiflexaceae bacterium]
MMVLLAGQSLSGSNARASNQTAPAVAKPAARAISKPSTYAWGTFTQIASGYFHNCALNSTGAAYCWGSNRDGLIGDGTTTDRSSPVAVSMPAGVTFTAIVAGVSQTCALNTVGAAYCWGGDNYGGLGNGTTGSVSTIPVAVTMPAGVSFSSLTAGHYHTCALTTTGTAYCWGYNNNGQLGNDTYTDSSVPVAVSMPAGVTFTAISAGQSHTCALTTTGTAYCWGLNIYGQLGKGDSNLGSKTPAAVTMPAGVSFTSLTVGDMHTCALNSAGTAYCWGTNQYGQLGNGTNTNQTVPVAITMPVGESFAAIKASYHFTCALTNTGNAYCWGENNRGQLGNGSGLGDRNTPGAVTMPASVSFTALSAVSNFACALTNTGTAYCWGSNVYGTLGLCDGADRYIPTLVSGCAPAATDTPTASNTSTPSRTNTRSATAVPSTDPWGTFTQVSTGAYHSCALNSTGAAYCWGEG